ncbi:unnamed protein product [Rotaria sp. Silwood1]|nr:unnamed protein product [Rotaria sp. Silwood1]
MYSDIDPRVRELGFVVKTLAKNEVWKDYGLNKLSSGELWIEFLRYYTEIFDYDKNIVTIRQFQPLPRSEKGWFHPTIAIEDPFILTHDLTEKLSLRRIDSYHLLLYDQHRDLSFNYHHFHTSSVTLKVIDAGGGGGHKKSYKCRYL